MRDAEATTYSVVIPCYRSASWLPELVARVEQAMIRLGGSFEILLVNDASPDGTWQAIEGIASRSQSVRGFDLLGNVGQFRATLCGLRHARGEIVVTLDDDFQNLPEDIAKLVRALEAEPSLDCVMGSYGRGKHGLWLRDAGTRVAARVRRSLRPGLPDLKISAFRAMRRPLVRALCEARTRRPILGPLMLQLSGHIANVDVTFSPRSRGESGYDLAALLRILRDEVVSTSALPLRVVATTGLVVAVGSLAVGMCRLLGLPSPERVAVAPELILICFFGGATLLAIGLLGEYVARILEEVSAPSWYQVRRETGRSAVAMGTGTRGDQLSRQDRRTAEAPNENPGVGSQ